MPGVLKRWNGTEWVPQAVEVQETNAVTSTDYTTIEEITQAEYDALSPPDANTLYVVVG